MMKISTSPANAFTANARFFLGTLCFVAPYLFPFSSGPSRDALSQLFAIGVLAVSSLLFGMSVISRTAWVIFAAALVLLMTASCAYSGGQVASMAGLLLLVLACHVGTHVRRQPAGLVWLLMAIVFSAVVSALEGLLQWFGLASALWPWVVEPESHGIAFGAFRQRNLFATFVCVGAVCTIWLVHARRMTESMAWVLSFILMFAVAASASRTGGLEIVALALLAWVWRGQQKMATTRLLVGQLFLFGLATFLLPLAANLHGWGFDSGVSRIANTSQDTRWIIWSNAVDLILARPWAGWGLQEMGYGHYVTLFEHRGNEMLSHAHNLLLQLAVEFGLPVAVALISVIAWSIYKGKPWLIQKGTSPQEDEVSSSQPFAWAILLLIVGIHGMLELPLQYAGFLFLTGIAMGYLLPVSGDDGSPGTAVRRPYFAALSSALLIVLAVMGWTQYQKVLLIQKAPFNDRVALRAAVANASDAWMFRGYVDFAALGLTEITPQNASDVRMRTERLLHFSAEPAVLQPLLLSLLYLRDLDAFRFHAERFCHAFPGAYLRWHQYIATDPVANDALKLSGKCKPIVP